jgi:hypothetical protein
VTAATRNNLLCQGSASASETCNPSPCPEWTEWSPWSDCSATCGRGKRQRARKCANPTLLRNGELVCSDGDPLEKEDCNSDECPQWSAWGEWTDCTRNEIIPIFKI